MTRSEAVVGPRMHALVYTGRGEVEVREVERPRPGPGEVIIAIDACGVCGTDVKKIDAGLLSAPRVFGHEMVGRIAEVGRGVAAWREGDRVVAHHHIPCRRCFYCERKLYAQCDVYKRNGTSAGFEAAGGGFAQFIRAEPHIVREGLIAVPAGVHSHVALFVEPVNTCLKAVEKARIERDEVVLVVGQGPIGSILAGISRIKGARVVVADLSPHRRALAAGLGFEVAPPDVPLSDWSRQATSGRGVDAVFLAATGQKALDGAIDSARPGARILAFSATSPGERYEVDLGRLASAEKDLLNAYSASVDVQGEAARLVFSGDLRLRELVSDVVPLAEAPRAIELFRRPDPTTMKVVVDMHA